jgi:hypothetical protein
MQGVDVSDVRVNRGAAAAREAHALGARAFTRGSEVVLPPAAGPLERPQARALLAHELTHAAQQRALGPALPMEGSAAGAALEVRAIEAERRVLGLDPAAGSSAPAPRRAAAPAIQRQTEELAGEAPPGNAFDPFALLPAQAPSPDPGAVPAGPPAQVTTPPEAAVAAADELGNARARLLTLAEQRLLDLDDPVAIGHLADGLYRRLRARLQSELLVSRERAGLLSDFR